LWLKCSARRRWRRSGQWAQSKSSSARESAPPENATAHGPRAVRDSVHASTAGWRRPRGKVAASFAATSAHGTDVLSVTLSEGNNELCPERQKPTEFFASLKPNALFSG